MKVHIVIDGFQAAVHQAITPELRHQPVAVAVDGSPQAVVFATSAEARRQRIWPGMRAEHARRRCPNLTVCLPDHERYRAAQEALLDVAYHWSPCVAGSGGRVDLDLDGTEHLWYDHFGTDDPLVQADTIAARCARVCQRRLRLPARVGSSHRLLLARLAARLARRRALDHLTLQPDTAWDELTPLPARWLPGLHDADLRLLADCHLDTIGGVRRLSQTQLTDILGQRGAAVWQILHDPQPEDESIPKRVEPEQPWATPATRPRLPALTPPPPAPQSLIWCAMLVSSYANIAWPVSASGCRRAGLMVANTSSAWTCRSQAGMMMNYCR
jgi:DNA polymerase-4